MPSHLLLPVIYCPDCTSQLGFSGVYLVPDVPPADELVCMFCARDRFKAGETGLRCVASSGTDVPEGRRHGWDGEGAPLDSGEAFALWVRHGAEFEVSGTYFDQTTGEKVTPDHIRSTIFASLGIEAGE